MKKKIPSRALVAQLAGCSALLAIVLASMVSGAAGASYPAPGTYKLHKIEEAASGWVLENSTWMPRRLSSYLKGQITLFSFFYSTCTDPAGCPVAWSAFEDVYQRVQSDPSLRGRVRLVFLSLDPRVDTPERLSVFADNRRATQKTVPWNFLTTWSESYLEPILKGMGQSAGREVDEAGMPTAVINHMLKVYLVDEEGWVREIYTTAFLQPDVLMNDIRTLVMEEDKSKQASAK